MNIMEFSQFPKNKFSLPDKIICMKASLTITQQMRCLSLSRECCFTGSWGGVTDKEK